MDIVEREIRSKMMSAITGKNTKPELVVRRAIFAEGLRYRLHRKDLPGKPDIVLASRKVVIFVHGCFWHMHRGCAYATVPASNPEFWQKKLTGNVLRDKRILDMLVREGWRVLTVWECATRSPEISPLLGKEIVGWIAQGATIGEIH